MLDGVRYDMATLSYYDDLEAWILKLSKTITDAKFSDKYSDDVSLRDKADNDCWKIKRDILSILYLYRENTEFLREWLRESEKNKS